MILLTCMVMVASVAAQGQIAAPNITDTSESGLANTCHTTINKCADTLDASVNTTKYINYKNVGKLLISIIRNLVSNWSTPYLLYEEMWFWYKSTIFQLQVTSVVEQEVLPLLIKLLTLLLNPVVLLISIILTAVVNVTNLIDNLLGGGITVVVCLDDIQQWYTDVLQSLRNLLAYILIGSVVSPCMNMVTQIKVQMTDALTPLLQLQ